MKGLFFALVVVTYVASLPGTAAKSLSLNDGSVMIEMETDLLPAEKRKMDIIALASKLGCNEFVNHLPLFPDLDKLLRSEGPFTVVVPTDEAFETFYRDRREYVKHAFPKIFSGHVVRGRVYSSQINNELLVPTALVWAGKPVNLRFNRYLDGKVTTATGSILTLPDQNATNGVIHVTDRVIYPQALYGFLTQMAEISNSTGLFLAAIELTGLADVLTGESPFTLFAPSNKAIREMENPTFDELMSDRKQLTDVLLYHLVSGTIFEAGLRDGDVLTTMGGKQVRIEGSENDNKDDVRVNFVEIRVPDVAVTNGVFHIMAGVLMPPEVRNAYWKKNNVDVVSDFDKTLPWQF
ncbi:periostin-like [Lineus longissimus]|uniref:periostin-like n=1 Tax=Lineus longissimus TaxID=88925 RepID=UPI00315D4150